MQLAYAIGVAEPVSVTVDTFGTGVIPDERFTELVRENFLLTPRGIIDTLKLRRPIYRKTAAFGHFGRTEETFTWEATDKAEALKEQAGVAQTAWQVSRFSAAEHLRSALRGLRCGDERYLLELLLDGPMQGRRAATWRAPPARPGSAAEWRPGGA